MAPISLLSGSQGEQLIRSVNSHPRYRLRMIAIGSVAIGMFFNTLSSALCHQPLLHGLAFLALCISIVWDLVDLVSLHSHHRHLPVGLLAFVDGLGFCSFLALLIVNGIIMEHMGHYYWHANKEVILMTYTSVPWMSCCGIHGFIALHNMFQFLTASGNALLVCPECCRSWKAEHAKPREAADRAKYSLMGEKDDAEYDVEADADFKYMDDNAGEENIPKLAASNEATKPADRH